jgi:hypothetical protein
MEQGKEPLKNAVLTFKGFKVFGEKVSVMTDAGYFGFFKNKKDGTPSKALETLKALEPKLGDSLEIAYKETEYNGKVYQNAVAFYAPREGSVPTMPLPRPEAQEDRNEVLMNLTENIHKLDDRVRILENRMSMLELPEEKKEVSIEDVPF